MCTQDFTVKAESYSLKYYNPACDGSCKQKHFASQSFQASEYLNRVIFKHAFKVIAVYILFQQVYLV